MEVIVPEVPGSPGTVAPVLEVDEESCCCELCCCKFVVVAPVGEPTSGEGLCDCVVVEELL